MWFLKFNYFTARLIKGPRPVRLVIGAFFAVIWQADQILAPVLDKLDKDPCLETYGYFVVARKKA